MALSLFCMDVSGVGVAEDKPTVRKAAAPLYRDPITDGAADPVLIWNRQEKTWWMLYTQRRANQETADVAYCYGNYKVVLKGSNIYFLVAFIQQLGFTASFKRLGYFGYANF